MNNFYEDSYHPKRAPASKECDLSCPLSIYHYLDRYVYKQDEYKRTAALILYEHLNGHRGKITLVNGPSGCGKTLVAETLRQIYPKVIIADASRFSKDGWNGSYKISDVLVQASWDSGIVFLDEFDKLVCPQHNSLSENVSASIQAELLKAFDGEHLKIKNGKSDSTTTVRCNELTWVLSGSFAAKAEEISRKKSSSGLGFNSVKNDYKPYTDKLTIQDLIDFGMLPELASRISRMVSVEPLDESDYLYLLSKHPASPLRKLEREYKIKLNLPKKTLEQIARDAYESGLGLRNCRFQIQKYIDERIYADFGNENVVPTV